MSQPRLRCAVYTRKSTEEGLDQEFNSLDAQHEACAAFIASQVGLGWKLVPERYDDGGISGGTMDRPALQRLLQDIRDRKIDVVVVYKIDRLTRSLMDFSRIVEIFDKAGASFVSVTQQFNTTTSMGRLTLNVLLSFAQFEREVTAERIRDKIAASKAKGMWMGGRIPFGYWLEDHKLLVEEKDAETVRWMFTRFLELRSVAALTDEIERSGKMPVRRISKAVREAERVAGKNGAGKAVDDSANELGQDGKVGSVGDFQLTRGGLISTLPQRPDAVPLSRISRGQIRWMLANPLYIGKLRHKGKIHDGEHTPIIEIDLFERVQRQLALGSPRRSSSSNSKDMHLLTGIVFDETGERLSPTSTPGQGKRYRYYVSSHLVRSRRAGRGGDSASIGRSAGKDHQNAPATLPSNPPRLSWRIPAELLDKIAFDQLRSILADKMLLSNWLQQESASRGLSMEDVFRQARSLGAQLERDHVGSLRKQLICKVFDRIVLSSTNVAFSVRPWAIIEVLSGEMVWDSTDNAILHGKAAATGTVLPLAPEEIGEPYEWPIHIVDLPIAIRRRGREQRIIIESKLHPSEPDANLVDIVGRAHFYLKELTSGPIQSIADLALKVGVHRADISRILPLAFLSPAIIGAILAGQHPAHLTPSHLSRMIDVPASWADQARALET